MSNVKQYRFGTRLLEIFVFVFVIMVTTLTHRIATAQTPTGEPPRCPDGAYMGRTATQTKAYIKDTYVWAVTKEFARRYCMPPEFIVNDLSGAEAIAYKLKFSDVQHCSLENGVETCNQAGISHLIEIYFKTGTIEKAKPEVGYYVDRFQYPTSSDLIGPGDQQRLLERAKRRSQARQRGEVLEPAGLIRPYYPAGRGSPSERKFVFLARLTEQKAEIRPAAFIEHFYFERWGEGIDLLTLSGQSWGAMFGIDYPSKAPFGYAIGLVLSTDISKDLPYDEYMYRITLPKRIVSVLSETDSKRGAAFEDAIKRLR